jgi:hypothetical protein
MNAWKPVLFAFLLIASAAAFVWFVHDARVAHEPDARSAGALTLKSSLESAGPFIRADSTALFIGVRDFTRDPLLQVNYAADDAVDLAYAFALDRRSQLVPVKRIALALSGTPQKEESKERLRELRAKGAVVETATQSDILGLVQKQSAMAGSNGIFILSIASHGFTDRDGDAYILGSNSAFSKSSTAISVARLLDIISNSPAGRSLIFIDACRDRVLAGTRSAASDPTTAAPAIARRMKLVHGQVVLYAAAPGHYAYDDPVRQNGVFTRTVIDGLQCNATATRGVVTVRDLRRYVDDHVRQWLVEQQKPAEGAAIQSNIAGNTDNMPLSECWRPLGAETLHVTISGTTLTVSNQNNETLWSRDTGAPIVHADVADLDGDGVQEVVIALRDSIQVFDDAGTRRWPHPMNHVRTFIIADLFRKHRAQIVALDGVTLTILDADGKLFARSPSSLSIRRFSIDRETTRHAPRIVAATDHFLHVFKPDELRKPLWSRHAPHSPIESLEVLDADHDTRRDIAATTAEGTAHFSFEGKVADGSSFAAKWTKVAWSGAHQPR